MIGFIPPEVTKEDIRNEFSKEDLKEVLVNLGYKLVPKESKFMTISDDFVATNTDTHKSELLQKFQKPTTNVDTNFDNLSMSKIEDSKPIKNKLYNLKEITCKTYSITLYHHENDNLENIA